MRIKGERVKRSKVIKKRRTRTRKIDMRGKVVTNGYIKKQSREELEQNENYEELMSIF